MTSSRHHHRPEPGRYPPGRGGPPGPRRGRPRHQLRKPKRNRAGTIVAILAAVALLAGGVVMVVYLSPGDGDPLAGSGPGDGGGQEEVIDLSTAQTTSRSVVTMLNRKDLDGLVAITCATGRSEGRRALVEAIPPLATSDPATAQVTFELGTVTEDKPGEAVAELTARYRDGTGPRADRGEMLLVDEVDGWRLCGLSMNTATAPPIPGPPGS